MSIIMPDKFEQLLAEANAKYGEISSVQLKRAIEVIDDFLSIFPRVFAMRVDLHFPQMVSVDAPDMPTCFPRADAKAITRFFASLESQLLAEHRRKGKQGTPAPFGYIWVKEHDASDFPHYHLILLFNKDDYAFLGSYANSDANNMAARIRKAWCSALQLSPSAYQALVHFPANQYWLTRVDATLDNENHYAFLLRIAYFFKFYSKVTDKRKFTCSQPIGNAKKINKWMVGRYNPRYLACFSRLVKLEE
jgi:hypothetical protein